MKSRKEMKREARQVFKRHYWKFVIICLLSAIIGTEFSDSMILFQTFRLNPQNADKGTASITTSNINSRFSDILLLAATGKLEEGKTLADAYTEGVIQESKESKSEILGRSQGYLSAIINGITSGSYLISIVVAIRSIVGSDSAAVMILIGTALLLILAVWIFGVNLYQVIMRRMFLEGRCYEEVHAQRALYLLKVRKWFQAARTILLMTVFQILWSLTVVGGVIKRYSYYLVPYIVAENPGIASREAITLSRRMMDGHKLECFVLELSFLGWQLLGVLAMGLPSIFFVNPYKTATAAEYYAELRQQAKEKEIPGAELLNDTYLFEKAEHSVLRECYADVAAVNSDAVTEPDEWKGAHRVFAKIFGVTLWESPAEKAYEENQARLIQFAYDREALDGMIYPTRLSPIPERNKRNWISGLHYIRYYSIWSLILMFFIMSFIGWLWEVSLHLLEDGVFVNRGVSHGPWLPIYGAGGTLILLCLNRFRKKPWLEFITAIGLCGIVEYATSYVLEIMYDGTKWWDYTGYLLNLNGRICAEGLLVFGLGGMVIVYVLAPIMDDMIRRIPMKKLVTVCAVLVCVFTADQIYSVKHPNQGAGITDYETVAWAEVPYVVPARDL